MTLALLLVVATTSPSAQACTIDGNHYSKHCSKHYTIVVATK
jgi:hypothetical protein